jgi:hypothetical protein
MALRAHIWFRDVAQENAPSGCPHEVLACPDTRDILVVPFPTLRASASARESQLRSQLLIQLNHYAGFREKGVRNLLCEAPYGPFR